MNQCFDGSNQQTKYYIMKKPNPAHFTINPFSFLPNKVLHIEGLSPGLNYFFERLNIYCLTHCNGKQIEGQYKSYPIYKI